MNRLDNDLRSYYQDQSLSPESSERILARARTLSTHPTSTRRPGWRSLAVAATLLLALSIWNIGSGDLTGRVLTEIAMNHGKQLQLEVVASDYSQVQTGLDRLGFALTPPDQLAGRLQLLGARYCSIQGQLAAQLRLRQPDTGQLYTLYMTPLTDELTTIGEQQQTVDGVTITLASGHGLFYGLATNP